MGRFTGLAGIFAAALGWSGMGPGLGPGAVRAQEATNEPHYRLSAATLACLVRHRDVYQAAEGEPVFLLADRCPPERPPTLLDVLVNEGPQLRLEEADRLDRLVTLSRSQLGCLDRLDGFATADRFDRLGAEDGGGESEAMIEGVIEGAGELVLFFPESCRVEPAAEPAPAGAR
jgi:hypothetical protein